MKCFPDENFLLHNPTALTLYWDYAKDLPIYDYHSHLSAKEIWENRHFSNLTQIWLEGDHYKWRLMRANGIDEAYITGTASDREKFQKYAETLPRAIGNPLYHWSHLELKNYFDYQGQLNGQTAQEVWDIALKKLAQPDFSVRNIIQKSKVAMIGTTDDPISNLAYHKKIAQSKLSFKVCPSFRPDPVLQADKAGFAAYIGKFSQAADIEIKSLTELCEALTRRILYFDSAGCRSADHGLTYVPWQEADLKQLEIIFQKALAGQPLSQFELEAYQTYLLLHCAKAYTSLDWVMQIHFSCRRNPNTKGFGELGPDSGFDCIAPINSSANLAALLDKLNSQDTLPKTILYSLNSSDNAWLDSLIGSFQTAPISGKIQHGAAWWFNDHLAGIQEHLISLASFGVLGNFIGMLTDSRSFLSYARHEYFRRILCNLLGSWVEAGEYPDDVEFLASIVADICTNNAKHYFNL